jgi:serine phosphatase RsbU (regulator of sigma subunit)/ABC-type amino acid transport substrate-binding protein
MKKLLLLIIFLYSFVFPAVAQDEYVRGNGWEAVRFMKTEGVLIVYYYENKPFIYTNDDELSGIEYDLLIQFRNYLKTKHNVNIKLVWKKAETTDDFYEAVGRGDRGSIGVGAVTITEDKKQHFKYSPPYMSDMSVIVSNEQVKDCATMEEFRAAFGAMQAISIEHSFYDKYLAQIQKIILPNMKVKFVRNNDELIGKIASADNIFGYVQLPSYLLALKNGDKIKRQKLFVQSNETGYGFVLPAKTSWDEPLKEFFNNMQFKDSVNAITKKYLGADISEFVTELENTQSSEVRSSEGNDIVILEKENAIKQLRLKDQEINNQKSQLFLVGGIFMVLTLATIFFWRFKSKQKANLLLGKINSQLVEKNEEISRQAEELAEKQLENERQRLKLEKIYESVTDSIRYARRIQEAILPDKAEIFRALPNSFIYFNPKDELSGDFYWFTQLDNLKIIASIDCTGHGVPGAFMTVMASTLLNHVVLEKKITNPRDILRAMDKGVQENMNKQTADGKRKMHDGMDMAICIIDESKKQVLYAAANQAICHVHKGVLQHIKGSNFPIGGFQFEQKDYKEQVINYEIGDTFYMYSDGYQDQFGGSEGRKFMSKRFREFLSKIHHLEPSAQETILRREIQGWRGTRTQTDDQMVIGFKL